MVVAKSNAGGAATSYFRTAKPLPSLVTVLGLGYFGVLACVADSRGRVLVCHCIVQEPWWSFEKPPITRDLPSAVPLMVPSDLSLKASRIVGLNSSGSCRRSFLGWHLSIT
nr:transmembrane protein 254 isoform X2 [Globicephala melas]